MKTKYLAFAALAAISLQPLVGLATFFPFWHGAFPSSDVFIFYLLTVLIMSSLIVVLLGLPCFNALDAAGKLTLPSLSCCGIFIGMLPYLLTAYPQHIAGYTGTGLWHGHMLKHYENGSPAAGAWLAYVETAVGLGFHGFVGSLVFYFFWYRYRTVIR